MPVRWSVDGGTATLIPTGSDGLSSFTFTPRNRREYTVEAVVPAKTTSVSDIQHPELRVTFTVTIDSTRPPVTLPDERLTVTFEDYPEDLPIDEFTLTIKFSEPVTGFQQEDITVETELDTGEGTATLKSLTPVGVAESTDDGEEGEEEVPAQTYTATIEVPADATGTVRLTVHPGAAFSPTSGKIGPTTDVASELIEFGASRTARRKIIYQCPVGWVRSDGFVGRNRRVLIYEVNVEIDMSNRVSIYKPVWVAIYIHPDEALENLHGWKLQVALPYNHHREYLLTAENSVVVDSKIEGVNGGFAFIKNPEEHPFPMVGMGFTGVPVPGFDYRLYDEMGKQVDFGISCYKRGDIFQVLKDMEDPSVLRNVMLETLNWDVFYIRSEWTVPVPVNVPGAPSLPRVNLVGKWADLKKQ